MRAFVSFLIAAVLPTVTLAQVPRTDATLRVTVADPSGAVIVGASVSVTPAGGASPVGTIETGTRGEAAFPSLEPGRYVIHVEAPGFAPRDARDVRLRPGDNRRDVTMAIASLAETVQVGRDAATRASDPRSDAFATVLGQSQIDELPDDPDGMEQALRNLAGPGAILRVNGFRGGRLPSKDQIQQIRFHRNMFAADAHESGFVSIDIITKPGLDTWSGSTTTGFRGSALNARNAFAPVKGDERTGRYGFSLSGPLKAGRTSIAVAADGLDAFDSKTIVAALPSGYVADSIRTPTDATNLSVRVEHGLSRAQILRAEIQRAHTFAGTLGVGDFDLVERGYSQTRTETTFRVSTSGSIRKSLFNEFRFQIRGTDTAFASASDAPAVLVLNAFNGGGAQLGGSRGSTQIDVADDLDVAIGKHAWRTGIQLEAGRFRSDEQRNTGGTFTFASLDDYRAGLATTFSRTSGNPHVEVSQAQFGLYAQDDYRARKNLTVSGGVRAEAQSHIGGLNLAPRGGFAWSPFRSGKTTVRGGSGVFFDWFDAQSYEQAVQLDGAHQRVDTIVEPGYPDPALGGRAVVLPPGRVRLASDLAQPMLRETMVGVEQTLPDDIRLSSMFISRRGTHQLRGVNVNAPLPDGRRPDPLSGPITEIASTAGSAFDGLSLSLNYMDPVRRIFVAANYMWSRSVNDADGPFSLPADSADLAAERGPEQGSARHQFMSLANVGLPKGLRLGTSLRAQSALPYDITTGRDDNGDTVSNDRPAGVTRNTGRGSAQVDLGARLSWSRAFGSKAPPPAGPQVRIVRSDSTDPLAGMGSGLDVRNKRYGIEVFAQAYNALNRTNALNYGGVITSPFFGRATSSAAPRRVELGARITF